MSQQRVADGQQQRVSGVERVDAAWRPRRLAHVGRAAFDHLAAALAQPVQRLRAGAVGGSGCRGGGCGGGAGLRREAPAPSMAMISQGLPAAPPAMPPTTPQGVPHLGVYPGGGAALPRLGLVRHPLQHQRLRVGLRGDWRWRRWRQGLRWRLQWWRHGDSQRTRAQPPKNHCSARAFKMKHQRTPQAPTGLKTDMNWSTVQWNQLRRGDCGVQAAAVGEAQAYGGAGPTAAQPQCTPSPALPPQRTA